MGELSCTKGSCHLLLKSTNRSLLVELPFAISNPRNEKNVDLTLELVLPLHRAQSTLRTPPRYPFPRISLTQETEDHRLKPRELAKGLSKLQQDLLNNPHTSLSPFQRNHQSNSKTSSPQARPLSPCSTQHQWLRWEIFVHHLQIPTASSREHQPRQACVLCL